jgi:hypothetical protein
MRKVAIPLNVGLPIEWYGLIVDDGAGGRTLESVDGISTPNNENGAQFPTVSRLVVEGGRVGVECVTKVWHEAEELELQLASVISLRGKEEEESLLRWTSNLWQHSSS